MLKIINFSKGYELECLHQTGTVIHANLQGLPMQKGCMLLPTNAHLGL